MSGLVPANEQERLATLRSYHILDTPPETIFDRVTHLAARIFDVPIATMSLIDENRQWFKSCVGLDTTETPREMAFCSHAILATDVLVIPDATADPRFSANPLVTGKPYIRFYAGAPLVAAPGLNLGTLCLIDTKPRDNFTDVDRRNLADLAALLMDELRFRQAAAELRRNEAKFRALTENTQDIITVLGADGTALFESVSIENVLGYGQTEIVGRNAFEFVHPEDHAYVIGEFQRTVGEGATVRLEFRFRHKDGSYRWVEAIGVNRLDDAAIRGVVVNSRDVTRRREAEERLRLLESVARTARDAILITEAEPIDPPGPRIIYVNEAFTKMTGYTSEEVIGKTPRILHGPKTDRAQSDRIRAALERWEPVVAELINYDKEGREFWVEISIVPVADPSGWYTHWVSVQRDMSERKRTEETLRRTTQEAEQANRAKSEFLSRMSHELRTPLNAILGFAQLLELDAASPEQQESADQILKAGRHLLDLINEVLDITRIEAGRMTLSIEPVDVDEAVADAMNTVRPLAAAQNIVLHAPTCGEFILADRQRIKQVLLNLLSNAIKYNRPGGSVRVTCVAVDEPQPDPGARRLRVSVSDMGAGISEENFAKLFTPFERLAAAESGVEGIGLGLTVCKRLVDLMGGKIGAESAVGVGSTFWFDLPQAENPFAKVPAQHPRIAPAEGDGVARKILYIEDNLSNLRLVERVLQRRPEISLVAAMQGQLGLELAEQHRPDLILLDLHLPDINGRVVLERLREQENTRAIPVIVISADATAGQVNRLLAAGAQGYLTKPFDVTEFMRAIDENLAPA